MYDWLGEALADDGVVITANRRLARVLREEYAQQQIERGCLAWASPVVLSWPDWLEMTQREADGQADLPTRINAQHSRVLWERCLRPELENGAAGLGNLVRLARDAWQRMADWGVPIGEVAAAGQSVDQRLFATVAGRYLAILERENWVDDAGIGALVARLLESGHVTHTPSYTFAGFERERPILARVKAALQERGSHIHDAPLPPARGEPPVRVFADGDAELRGAGAWAREQLQQAPEARIAIVVSGLERDAERCANLVREGLVPGWQVGPDLLRNAVNVSYGQRLADYPVVSVALLWLRWLVRDLSSLDVSHLLRSPLLGDASTGGRARLEQRVRRLPDRLWAPAALTALLRGKEEAPETTDWIERVAALTQRRRALSSSDTPAAWAAYIDDTLRAAGWPGTASLDSHDFQVVNRWRDLLNDLARLDLVSPRLSLETALRQLEIMAAELLFQPEAAGTRVHVLGALEAAGTEFDAVWLTGLSAANWPPAGNPSALLSRRLQERHGMPDAAPADTVAHAERLLTQLLRAAPQVVCSYPATDDDAEQTPSNWLRPYLRETRKREPDPGWFAASLVGTAQAQTVADPVPAIASEEKLGGGAGTIQRQLNDPVAAFITARLGVRSLQPQMAGLPALLRGNLVHDALYYYYRSKPTRADLGAWESAGNGERVEEALDFAFKQRERHADEVLRELFAIERERVAALLRHFLALDQGRPDFSVQVVEGELEFALAGVRLELRVDRIDRLADGRLAILDYKTGAGKKFLVNGEPREIQLVAYAVAVDEAVGALALANLDARECAFHGAGEGFTPVDNFAERLADWKTIVENACQDMSRGDVRTHRYLAVSDARPLALLTRYMELQNEQ